MPDDTYLDLLPDAFAEDALELVNTARRARGLDPLTHITWAGAVRGDPERCLFARAIDCDVNTGITIEWGNQEFEATCMIFSSIADAAPGGRGSRRSMLRPWRGPVAGPCSTT